MNKAKRVAAMIGIILIVSMYLLTFVSAFFTGSYTKQLFTACIFSTFVVPVMIYAYMLIYKLVHKNNLSDTTEDITEDTTTDIIEDKKEEDSITSSKK